MLVTDPLDEVESNSAQSVSVGYHNFSDTYAHDFLKKPIEAFALEVHPTGGVRKHLKPRVGCLQVFGLTLQDTLQ